MFDGLGDRIGSARILVPAACVGVALADAIAVEPYSLRVARPRVRVSESERVLDGMKVAHLSDFHVGGRGWKRSTVEAAIEAANREDVDLIAITGDFLGSGRGVAEAVELLEGLRRDIPCFGVYGNHDHVYGTRYFEALAEGLNRLGVRCLANQMELVPLPGGQIRVAGVDDGYSMRDSLGPLFECEEGDRVPSILLTHYPEVAERLAPGQAQLSLAGHSHGGQIRLPIVGELVHRSHARTRYGRGMFRVNGNPLHVTSGVGTSGIPVRFLNPPEIAVITFEADRQA